MRKFRIYAIAVIFIAAAYAAPRAQEADPDPEGKTCAAFISGITGDVEFRKTKDDEWEVAGLDQCLFPGDMIRTKEGSAVALQIGDNVETRINESSEFIVAHKNPKEKEDVNMVDMEIGELWAEMDPEKKGNKDFSVNTPSGVVAVKGTEFNVAVDKEGKSKVNVLDGVVEVFNELGKVLAEAGMATEMFEGKIPGLPTEFNVDEFKKGLDEWKNTISIGEVKEVFKKKVEEKKEEIKKDFKKKLKF